MKIGSVSAAGLFAACLTLSSCGATIDGLKHQCDTGVEVEVLDLNGWTTYKGLFLSQIQPDQDFTVTKFRQAGYRIDQITPSDDAELAAGVIYDAEHAIFDLSDERPIAIVKHFLLVTQTIDHRQELSCLDFGSWILNDE